MDLWSSARPVTYPLPLSIPLPKFQARYRYPSLRRLPQGNAYIPLASSETEDMSRSPLFLQLSTYGT
mgnify:CR=1 FL=1